MITANARAMRRAQNHRATEPTLRSVAEPGRVVHQLIDAGIKESQELDFANRIESLRRHADAEVMIALVNAMGKAS